MDPAETGRSEVNAGRVFALPITLASRERATAIYCDDQFVALVAAADSPTLERVGRWMERHARRLVDLASQRDYDRAAITHAANTDAIETAARAAFDWLGAQPVEGRPGSSRRPREYAAGVALARQEIADRNSGGRQPTVRQMIEYMTKHPERFPAAIGLDPDNPREHHRLIAAAREATPDDGTAAAPMVDQIDDLELSRRYREVERAAISNEGEDPDSE